jgi:hypothetical protein
VYWVALDGDDGNAGSADRPWRHLRWALSRPFLRGGDVIRIRGGVYRAAEDVLVRPVASGEPGRPITVMAQSGDDVVLSGRRLAEDWQNAGPNLYFHEYQTPAVYPWDHPFQVVEDGRLIFRVSSLAALDRPGRCWVDPVARRIWLRTSDGRPPGDHRVEYGVAVSGIEFRGVSHWRLTGFTVEGFRSAGVMIASGAGAIEIDRMEIRQIGAHRPGADPTNGYALAVYDSTGGNHVHHSRFHHTLAEAVHISQTAGPGDRYEENEIHNNGGPEWLVEGQDPRRLFGPGLILRASGMRVERNRIYGNGYHGLILESDLLGSEGPASPGGNVVGENTLAFNGGNGIYLDGKNGRQASSGNLLRFNLLHRNNQARSGSDADAEMRIAGNLDDTQVANNTLYSEHANALLISSARLTAGAAQGADAFPDRLRIGSNIVVHARRGRTWALRAVEPPADLVVESNAWHRPDGGALFQWDGVELASLEDLRRRTGQERRGLAADPHFVSAETGHFWLRAISPALGLGAFPYRPLLAVAPAEVRFVTVAGGRNPPAQAISVASACGAPLGWSARTADRWMALSSGPGRIELTALPAGLAAGRYSGTVYVTPALEGEPPLAVPVSLTVVPAPARRRQ